MANGITTSLEIVALSMAAKPAAASDEVLAGSKRLAKIGTNAPAATIALSLFSMSSAMSNGRFQPGGSTAPKASFMNASNTINKPVPQNHGWAYHETFARWLAGVWKY